MISQYTVVLFIYFVGANFRGLAETGMFFEFDLNVCTTTKNTFTVCINIFWSIICFILILATDIFLRKNTQTPHKVKLLFSLVLPLIWTLIWLRFHQWLQEQSRDI
jgi:hypothetical protein